MRTTLSAAVAVAIVVAAASIGLMQRASAAPGDVTRVSVNSAGIEANDYAIDAAVSGNGRYVAFTSRADNLDPTLPPPPPNSDNRFVHDRQTGITKQVNFATDGSRLDPAWPGAFSNDGRFFAFRGANGVFTNAGEWWLRDLQLNTTEQIDVRLPAPLLSSSASSGAEDATAAPASSGSGGGPRPLSGYTPDFRRYTVSMSADGRYVTFPSDASDVVAGDTNNAVDVFVRDRVAGTTERVSVNSAGQQTLPNLGNSYEPHISADGRYVVFESSGGGLIPGEIDSGADENHRLRMSSFMIA